MATDLAKAAKERGIKYFLISYVDLFGVLRAKLSPAQAITQMMNDGAGFAGFATWLDLTPAQAERDRVRREVSIVALAGEPLLLRRRHDRSVLDQSGCGVVVEPADPQDVHAATLAPSYR